VAASVRLRPNRPQPKIALKLTLPPRRTHPRTAPPPRRTSVVPLWGRLNIRGTEGGCGWLWQLCWPEIFNMVACSGCRWTRMTRPPGPLPALCVQVPSRTAPPAGAHKQTASADAAAGPGSSAPSGSSGQGGAARVGGGGSQAGGQGGQGAGGQGVGWQQRLGLASQQRGSGVAGTVGVVTQLGGLLSVGAQAAFQSGQATLAQLGQVAEWEGAPAAAPPAAGFQPPQQPQQPQQPPGSHLQAHGAPSSGAGWI